MGWENREEREEEGGERGGRGRERDEKRGRKEISEGRGNVRAGSEMQKCHSQVARE
jgi:hypothetical protein